MAIAVADYDNDGDVDIFVGGRLIPGRYPYAPPSTLLINEKGKYHIKTSAFAAELSQIGMVTDATWHDIDLDSDLDLIIAGEWMGIEVFVNDQGLLKNEKQYHSLSKTVGWWNKLLVADVDNDGDQDIVAGNLGLNSKYHASFEKPFHIYTKDFDRNGTEDIFLAKYYGDRQVPVRGKTCTAQQMPVLNEKIKNYMEFANLDLHSILGDDIKTAIHLQATEFRSGIFINDGTENFEFVALPYEVQRSPINGILFYDYDGDGHKDLLLAGNNHQMEIETTRSDAGIASFLKGHGNGHFTFIPNHETGFFADKDVRNMVQVNASKNKTILVINNNDKHDLFTISN